MTTNIIINLQVEGMHNWPACNIESVRFLASEHRHIFYITCKKAVIHSDRDIEIISFKRSITEYLLKKYRVSEENSCNFKGMSCEMIAEELVKHFSLSYCSVLEDNENGAEVVA